MPKVSKKAKASKSAAPSAAPASVKAAKSKTSKKEVQETVAPAAPETVEVPTLSEQFSDLLGQLATLRNQVTAVTTQVRVLAKRSERELKQALKASKKKRKSGNKEPSGFTKPAKISSELAAFLGKAEGTEMARTEVTKELTQYIKQHSLQDSENKRRINCDSALKSLLNVSDSDEVTYFNLQRYMKIHLPTSGSNSTASA